VSELLARARSTASGGQREAQTEVRISISSGSERDRAAGRSLPITHRSSLNYAESSHLFQIVTLTLARSLCFKEFTGAMNLYYLAFAPVFETGLKIHGRVVFALSPVLFPDGTPALNGYLQHQGSQATKAASFDTCIAGNAKCEILLSDVGFRKFAR
jgi:hypothetical protein